MTTIKSAVQNRVKIRCQKVLTNVAALVLFVFTLLNVPKRSMPVFTCANVEHWQLDRSWEETSLIDSSRHSLLLLD